MSLAWRLTLCALVLGGGVVAQYALASHLARMKDDAFTPLHARLADLPLDLSPAGSASPALDLHWQGSEHPGRAEVVRQVPFADEVFYRTYYQPQRNLVTVTYAAYSNAGEDRKHHPEICMREGAGAPEDLSARRQVPLDGDGRRLAQRFRFRTGTAKYLTLYYWHYTLPALPDQGESGLQRLHRRLIASPPSITVQVSTPHNGEDLEVIEQSYLPALDAALRARVLPEGAVVGSDRIPITMLRR